MKVNIKSKVQLMFITIILLSMLPSCYTKKHNITEHYIKVYKQEHKLKEFSNIRIKQIYSNEDYDNSIDSYIEFAGVKYNNQKFLVVGIAKITAEQDMMENDIASNASEVSDAPTSETPVKYQNGLSYATLSVEQCMDIVEKIEDLQKRIKSERTELNENVYFDYTVADDLIISVMKNSDNSTSEFISIWIKGQKHSVRTVDLSNALQSFLKYNYKEEVKKVQK